MSTRPRKREHIDEILRQWPYGHGDVAARIVKGADGREVLQLRLDLGLLQMEPVKRPDGARPDGADTYYDHLVELVFQEGDSFTLSDEQCIEIDREFVQFYHRRIAWLALRKFREAVRDADHTLALMDFSRDHSSNEDWVLSHEQYRPFVLFQRTQALALAELEDQGAEGAVKAINEGLDVMRQVFLEYEAEDQYEEDELVVRLSELRESIRGHYHLGPTLEEKLQKAIAAEQYELAARLRDEIRKKTGGH